MLDIKQVRQDPHQIADALKKKRFEFPVDEFLRLDSERKAADIRSQELLAERKKASKAVGALIAQGKTVDEAKAEVNDSLARISSELDAAVEVMDELVGTVWSAVQDRAVDHGEDWLILITTDHGRDVATGRDHGGQSERERTTWMVTNSHRLSPRFYQRPAIVDIYPSLARHLEISLPASVAAHLDGRSFIE